MTDSPPYLQPFVLTVPDEVWLEVERAGDVDLYRPHGQGRVPAILFVHGGPAPPLQVYPRDWPVYRGYGAAAAERGVVGAVVDHPLVLGLDRLADASDEVEAAVGRLRADPQVDPQRIALWFFSGAGLLAGEWLDSRPDWLRCVALTYPRLKAPAGTPELTSAIEVIGRQSDLPVLLTRAGREREDLAEAVEEFVAAAHGKAALRIVDVPGGRHGFDHLDHTEESREAVRHGLARVAAALRPEDDQTGARPVPPRTSTSSLTTSRKTPVTTPTTPKTTIPAPSQTPGATALTTAERPAGTITTPNISVPPLTTPTLTTSAPAPASPGVDVPVQPPIDTPQAQVVARQLLAFGANDLDAFLALYSPTARVHLADGAEVTGRRALREYFGAQLASGRAWVEVASRLTQGEWVVDHQVIHGIADRPVRTIVLYRVQNRAVVEVRYLA